ncbi:MAG: hypothetical protein A3G18_06075 [Rhodospirillales bacterium RIFCSPLOWO2_12_FULL_58_28]|nr:MAG: hypothetical protein A3H92_06080 [Rhodospirillales bacterium RIFCSPLOWO2_02_FULL_58_16]OHC77268.1 MAG: hypothetical protein A3G18_06075 [Rhodospirillales bacterium RIFCSPLOWO2_12_FULL_58_28]
MILDAGENGIIGDMVVTNVNDVPVELLVEGEGPVLRGKHIIRAEDANTPSLKIYYMITCMYINPGSFEQNYKSLLKLSRELVTEVPSTGMIMADIGECLIDNDLRGAHEKCFELLRYEAYLEQVVADGHGGKNA